MSALVQSRLSGRSLLFTALFTCPGRRRGICHLTNRTKSGTLRVGMSTFAPWAMRDKQGVLIDFEIDVARRLAPTTAGRSNSSPPPGMASFLPCWQKNMTSS